MIPYYDELNDEEKDAVTKVIRTLLRQTFILERKYDKKVEDLHTTKNLGQSICIRSF